MSVCKFRERQPCKNIARDYNLVPAFLGKDKEKERRRGARSPRHHQDGGVGRVEAARHKREKRKNKAAAAGGAKRGKEDGRNREFADIEHLPGFELLSDGEKVLCSSLNLSPKHFVTVKTIIIKDDLPKRQGIPSKSRLPSYLDKVLKKWILNFLTESRWISRDAS
ncbi:hypothetical protein JEQ12_007821 [Ovis aries]|uniref:Ada2b tri-helical domain-containing protein n=1 Tax=Ovis aries TaxID=9940 RepID=A0A836CWM6_SHEEP|nr:hypothetical protein JEQ12_007821 [Ovis aries]